MGPMVQVAESITQVPVEVAQYAEKVVPKVITEARETIQEVPQVLLEEQLVQVPQTQAVEVIRQVPKEQVQVVQRGIPKISTQVAERVVNVPCDLINETAVEVPQIQTVEVLKQTAAVQQQRIVQTSRQWEQAVGREVVAREAVAERGLEVVEAPVAFVREGVAVQPTVVERVSPIMTTELFAAPVAAPVVEYAASRGVVSAAPVVTEVFGAPTYATGVIGAPGM